MQIQITFSVFSENKAFRLTVAALNRPQACLQNLHRLAIEISVDQK